MVSNAVTALFAAGAFACLGYLLRFREWTEPIQAFVSAADSDADPRAVARTAGTGMFLLAVPFALYGLASLAGVGRAALAPVFFAAALFVLYRLLHWLIRADDRPSGPP